MRRSIYWAMVGLAMVACFVAAQNREEPQLVTPDPHFGRVARLLANDLEREHLTRAPLDNTIAQKAFDGYLSSLDYERVYFLNGDVEKFSGHVFELDDEVKRGELTFAYAVFETLKQRVRNRVAYIEKLLDRGFDFDVEESYRWKRKNEPWAADEAAWDALWRKRIKNEYLRIAVDRQLRQEEAAAATNSLSAHSQLVLPLATNTTTAVTETLTTTTTYVPATNDIPQALAGSSGSTTNDTAALELDEDELSKTPEEIILNRYRQYLTVLEDSDAEWVLQKYLTAFATSYDPHCEYMSPTSVEDFDIEMRLSLVGIGAMLRSEDGAAKIVSILPGGPADQDKRDIRLRPGDKIVAVAQGDEPPVSILHWPLKRAVRLIRGKKGSTVVLTVIPATDPTGTIRRKVALVRDEVKLEESEAKQSIHTITHSGTNTVSIGVIDLPAFYADLKRRRSDPNAKSSTRDVARLLRQIQDEGAQGVILDLRNNGGGSLLEAIDMTGLFISSGPTVQVKNTRTTQIMPDTDPNIAYGGPLVVLVNRLSASASEILAAALQDYGRAVLIGDSSTHGKGTVQTIIPLSQDNRMGSLKVTSALFYRISGGSTQLRGVHPDIVIPSALEYMDLGEDKLPNALPWSSVRPVPFARYADLSALLPKLRERSSARRASDERYIAYTKLLKRVEAFNNSDSLPLDLQSRKSKAREERELFDMQNKLLEKAGADGHEDDVLNGDLILRESLEVVADMIELDGLVERYPGIQGSVINPLRILFGP